ncbi:MAG: Asp-tRNA(Asn)/Glu-tRNA(Gln) amidotransferase subunit GatC [candidate division Zixibacteria bacterium]|nr:Asp-tRNA(Asn)/Glu-tRNA(Gln) amidotransferase subunit GatC [candidate division Zixibacteria bacterium]
MKINRKITRAEIENTAGLARLYLTDEETSAMHAELGEILEYFAVIENVELSNAGELSHPLKPSLELRKDEVTESLPLKIVLANAPAQSGGFFKVSRVL